MTSAKDLVIKHLCHNATIMEELKTCTTKAQVLNLAYKHSPPLSRSQLTEIESGT